MTDTRDMPIQVDPNTVPLAAALRYLITIAGTTAVARGWVEADNVEGIVTAIVTLGTVFYGLYRTHRQKSQLVVAAEAAPNSVAQVTA